jgi:transposase
MGDFMMRIEAFRDETLVAVESTGNHWVRLYDFLLEEGVRVVLSNPSKTRLIAEAKIKTDRENAKTLLSF